MDNICIIPARGGSKRLPGKNIKHFLGKPIIAYSIQAAIDSNLFDEVMVSTDDTEIAEIAKKYGANVPFLRSKNNSDDNAAIIDVLNEVINNYLKQSIKFENLCCIFPCAPFVTADKLTFAFEQLIKSKFDSIFPVVRYSYPIQRALALRAGKVKMVQDKYLNTMTQEFEVFYHDTGQFYFCNTNKVISQSKLMTQNSKGIEVLELEVQDIDSEGDWKLAELKYKLMNH